MKFTNRNVIKCRNSNLVMAFIGFVFIIISFILYGLFSNFNVNYEKHLLYMLIVFQVCFSGLIICLVGFAGFSIFNSDVKGLTDGQVRLIEAEISSSDSIYLKHLKVYLTPNYLVVMSRKFKFYRYCDIIWVYTFSGNGYTNVRFLTTNGDTICCSYSIFSKIDKTFKEYLLKKNPNIVFGYTFKNRTYFNKLFKDKK